MSADATQVEARTGSGKPSPLMPWWGRFDVEPGAALHFRIGPREQVKLAFEREGIEIPFPQTRIHVSSEAAAEQG